MTRFSFRPRAGLPILLLLAALSLGCDSNGGGPEDSPLPDNGTASFTINGTLTERFEGRAFFAVGSDIADTTSGIGLVLYRTTAQDTSLVLLASEGSNETPAAGSYAIVLDTSGTAILAPDEFVSFFATRGSTFYLAFAENGTLTVSSSSNDQLRGNFSFDGHGVGLTTPTATGGPIAMSGSFAAVRARGETLRRLLRELDLDDDLDDEGTTTGSGASTIRSLLRQAP